MLKKTIFLTVVALGLAARAGAQSTVPVQEPPLPYVAAPQEQGLLAPIIPQTSTQPAVYADAWRLKSDPLDLKTAAEELGRGPIEGQAQLYRFISEQLAAAGGDDKAARLLENYRLQGGKDRQLVTALAYYYGRLGAPAEGVTVLERLASQLPEDTQVTLELARFYRLKGDDKAADALVEAKARSNPKDVFLQRALAAVRRDAKDYAGAAAALRLSLDGQRDPQTYKQLALAYAAQGDLAAALNALEEGRKALPDYYDELTELSGELCYQKGERDKAVKIFKDLAGKYSDPLAAERFTKRVKEISDEISRGGKPAAGVN